MFCSALMTADLIGGQEERSVSVDGAQPDDERLPLVVFNPRTLGG